MPLDTCITNVGEYYSSHYLDSTFAKDVKDLVAGSRGRRVFDDGDLDAGIWSVGTVMGLIHDVPTVSELVSRIVREAEEIITGRLGGMVDAAGARLG